MKLRAILTEDELRSIAHSLVPLRIDLGANPEDSQRWLDIERLLDTELLADEGLMLATNATVRWPERSLLSEFRVERLELLVRPRLESTPSGAGLVIELRCRDLDINWVPSFVDHAIVKRINARLAENGVEFRWDFSDTLTFTFSGTSERSNINSIGLDLSTAELSISGGEICLAGPMQIRIDRREPRELELEAEAGQQQVSADEPEGE